MEGFVSAEKVVEALASLSIDGDDIREVVIQPHRIMVTSGRKKNLKMESMVVIPMQGETDADPSTD